MLTDLLKTFFVGGGFCLLAQILICKTKLTPARILTGYVCLGVLLTAVGVYPALVEFAGAGATVPLTGFGFSLAKGVRLAVDQQGAAGILTGGLTATSGGIAAAIVFSLTAAFLGKSKDR
ncbi:MAG: SpoVA/SpoVAEb family sporulation membrane protein [Clostridia bacterium]|nr:SpoVA/SpoVAEb family sporulation membrane protein [Clostridia bacterium]